MATTSMRVTKRLNLLSKMRQRPNNEQHYYGFRKTNEAALKQLD